MHFFKVFSLSLLLSLFLSLCSSKPNTTPDQSGIVLAADSLVGGMTSLSLVVSDVYSCNSNYSTGLMLDICGLVVTDAAASTEFVRRYPQTETNANATTVSGYYIDIFDSVMVALPYAVRYEYVLFETPDGSSAGSYDDLVYQIHIGNYDAAVGDTTITAKRSEYVDFTLPTEDGGVKRIEKIKYENPNNQWLFLKPLTTELWLVCLAAFIILTGVVLWILQHRRHNGEFRGPPSQHVGLIFYAPFTSLVFARRQKIVTNLAGVVVGVWVFVVLILSSTYTASLAVRYTASMLQKADTNVNNNNNTLIRTEAAGSNVNFKPIQTDHKRVSFKALSSKLCLTAIALFVLITAALCKDISFYLRISTVWSKLPSYFQA